MKTITWNGEQADAKSCPFCGQLESLDSLDRREDEEDDNIIDEYNYVAICCNVNAGGCGSSSGFRKTLKEAAEIWNKRAKNEQD